MNESLQCPLRPARGPARGSHLAGPAGGLNVCGQNPYYDPAFTLDLGERAAATSAARAVFLREYSIVLCSLEVTDIFM